MASPLLALRGLLLAPAPEQHSARAERLTRPPARPPARPSQALPLLQQQIPIQRARMRLRLQAPLAHQGPLLEELRSRPDVAVELVEEAGGAASIQLQVGSRGPGARAPCCAGGWVLCWRPGAACSRWAQPMGSVCGPQPAVSLLRSPPAARAIPPSAAARQHRRRATSHPISHPIPSHRRPPAPSSPAAPQADPGAFRELTAMVQTVTDRSGRLEVLSMAVTTEEGGSADDFAASARAAAAAAAAAAPSPSTAAPEPASRAPVARPAARQQAGAGGSGAEVVYAAGPVEGIPEQFASRKERFAELDGLQPGWTVELRSRGETVDAVFFAPSGEKVGAYAQARRLALQWHKANCG
jgi:hypothetical protein